MALTNAFECVNADRIRLSGNGGWFRVAFFPRLFRPTLPLVNSQSEFASRDVEGISAPWNERRLDGQSRPAPHGGRPFFFCGSTLQFHNPPCLFPSPSPSFAPRPPLLSFAPELLQGSEESDEVAVYRYRPAGNSNLPFPPVSFSA